jgi:predicted NBD/HSP70 family sugar kinase
MPKRTTTAGLAEIMGLVAAGRVRSRAGLARELDAARSTVGLSVDFLLETELLAEVDVHDGSRGRPIRMLVPGPRSGSIALIDFRPACTVIGIADITGTVRALRREPIRWADGAEASINSAIDAFSDLYRETDDLRGSVLQTVVAVAAPVNHRTGALERWSPRRQGRNPIPGWEEYHVTKHIHGLLKTPTLLENDANLLALADATAVGPAGWPLVRFELSLGIGSGIIDERGELFRGAGGTAGDLGHIASYAPTTTRCWCGKTGCVAVRASIQAILEHLGIEYQGAGADFQLAISELRERLITGDAAAIDSIADAAEAIGELAATVVDMLNPATLVLGGDLMHLGFDILAEVRAVVYKRALSVSTRRLQITTTEADGEGAIAGAAILGARSLLSDDGIERLLQDADSR